MICLFVTCCGHVMSRLEHIGVQAKSEVIDHQQEDRPRIMYTWKEVLPTKGLECGGLPCARKLKLAIST